MKYYILIIFFLFLLKAGFSQTDSCEFIYGEESSLLIFTGTVKKVRQTQIKGSRYEVKFCVDSVLKGNVESKFYVYTSTNTNCYTSYAPCDLCGFTFKKGKRYIVYVCGYEHGIYTVSSCTFTKELFENEAIILQNDLRR